MSRWPLVDEEDDLIDDENKDIIIHNISIKFSNDIGATVRYNDHNGNYN